MEELEYTSADEVEVLAVDRCRSPGRCRRFRRAQSIGRGVPRSAAPDGHRSASGTRRARCRLPVLAVMSIRSGTPGTSPSSSSRIGGGNVQSAARLSGRPNASAPPRAGISRRARRGATRRALGTGSAAGSGRSSAGTPSTTGPRVPWAKWCPTSSRSRRPTRTDPSCGRDRRGRLSMRCSRPPMRSQPSARSLGTKSQLIRPSPSGWLRTTNGRLAEVKCSSPRISLSGRSIARDSRRAARSSGCRRWSVHPDRPRRSVRVRRTARWRRSSARRERSR